MPPAHAGLGAVRLVRVDDQVERGADEDRGAHKSDQKDEREAPAVDLQNTKTSFRVWMLFDRPFRNARGGSTRDVLHTKFVSGNKWWRNWLLFRTETGEREVERNVLSKPHIL